MKYIVRVTVEGQTWYLHLRGLRVNSKETAIRYDTKKDAEYVAEYYEKHMQATDIRIEEVKY